MLRKYVMKAPMTWWAGGLMLALVQIFAVAVQKPLGVSTQFVVADTYALKALAPDYVETHQLISKEKYQKIGYGWWLNIGLIAGALVAGILAGRCRLQTTTVWWRATYGHSVGARLIVGFIGGFLILLGARMGHGCTSGQLASGWAQLSLSVVPFTIGLFVCGMLTAFIVYRKKPQIEQ